MASPTPWLRLDVPAVRASCRYYRRPKYRTPDLQKLIDRGQGDTPLLELPHIRRLTG
jgi:hypothetical protein